MIRLLLKICKTISNLNIGMLLHIAYKLIYEVRQERLLSLITNFVLDTFQEIIYVFICIIIVNTDFEDTVFGLAM